MAPLRTAPRFSLLFAVAGALALSACGGEPAPQATQGSATD